MKQKAKKELIEQETIYGIRPTTPAKLRANMTSAKVTSSSLKRKAPGSVTPGGPGGVGGGAKRLHLAPVGSTSTMTRARAAGNVTGSAKNETRVGTTITHLGLSLMHILDGMRGNNWVVFFFF